MFHNLRMALRQKGISVKQYAEVLGIGEKTVQNKLTVKTDLHIRSLERPARCFLNIMRTTYLPNK